MRGFALLLPGVLALLLGLSTGAKPPPSAAPAFGNVTLDARPLGQRAAKTVLPAHRYSEDDPLEWGHPAYLRFALGPEHPELQDAVLSVYPLAGLLAANDGDAGKRLRAELAGLRTLLKAKPAKLPRELPYLLEPNAGQVFVAQARFLDFVGGSGVRFLTMYSSDVSPVTGDRLFYTFQGLTADGRLALVLTYPVGERQLPANYDAVPAAQRDALSRGEGYEAYLARTTKVLEAAPSADFSPSLAALDAVVRSIRARP